MSCVGSQEQVDRRCPLGDTPCCVVRGGTLPRLLARGQEDTRGHVWSRLHPFNWTEDTLRSER